MPLSVSVAANAIGRNPYPPRIPCHRVIRSDGTLGGYSGKGGLKPRDYCLKRRNYRLELLFDGRFSLYYH